ncbi:hypothetical protein [Nocardia acidivorans]|uniref:hypothetical protein n=1 Tax=Nocardia acidivorans TaxID=404580 RepID=UPI000832A6D8|nr:hypothetical protein [Nocardia acidivorans]
MTTIQPSINATVLKSLLHNGIVHRALALAVATVVLLAVGQPTWVPYAVSLYAIWNAAAVTLNAVKAASNAR